jgi:hypothetical protein
LAEVQGDDRGHEEKEQHIPHVKSDLGSLAVTFRANALTLLGQVSEIVCIRKETSLYCPFNPKPAPGHVGDTITAELVLAFLDLPKLFAASR